MDEAVSGILDGTLMVYTYPEMGTVSVSYRNGSVSFEWVAGPLKGEVGEDFVYRAREVGGDQFFVNWHEPDAHGFVTLHIDFQAGWVHSSVLAAYATNEEQILFHRASIERVERSSKV
jgi:MoaF-like